ncbi:uncharacterized protein [Nicotiana sylvestris]|uniref:uncharacterized protein n=1 Tax=Nicotiana sylvestris TaxID=4096 RepID=UPI00388CD6F2
MPETVVPKTKDPLPRPPPPYPQRLAKQKNENQFKKFIDMMKSLSINVPLVEALEKMSGYAKFMKDLVTKKRSMHYETIKMTHQVIAIVHSMALKLEDPGAFTIPCIIGCADFAKALCDLGASINLLAYSIFKTLGIGKPRPTSMRLQMADRTMKRPLGIIDDVLVRVDIFILPADFVILDCEVYYEVSIILGRPFLATGKALVDVEAGELIFRLGDEKVIFHVCNSMKQPNSSELCSFVDLVTDVIVYNTSAMINVEDPLEAVLLNLDVNSTNKTLNRGTSGVGVEAFASTPQVDSTLVVLQKRKKVIGWSLVDIRGISPAFLQCVPKKGGMTVVTNTQNELITTKTVTRWRVCMDYFKLYKMTHKDHFPLPFLDQMLDRLVGSTFYCILDGYSGYNQILIALEDQEKTTFTCPYGTFAFSRMTSGLCDAPATF